MDLGVLICNSRLCSPEMWSLRAALFDALFRFGTNCMGLEKPIIGNF